MGWAKCKPFALAGEPTSATLILSRDAALVELELIPQEDSLARKFAGKARRNVLSLLRASTSQTLS